MRQILGHDFGLSFTQALLYKPTLHHHGPWIKNFKTQKSVPTVAASAKLTQIIALATGKVENEGQSLNFTKIFKL